MDLPFALVDAFAHTAFSGNPAGVIRLPSPRDEAWMQQVASEIAQAETAFLWALENGWSLRWFTPTVEVDLCGHATLAAAHALWQWGDARPNAPIAFHTKSGRLVADRDEDTLWLDFPAEPPTEQDPPYEIRLGLAGLEPKWAGRNRMDWFVQIDSANDLRYLRPNLTEIESAGLRGLIVTAQADDRREADFVSRFFAPACGVPEDSVTGSAHCALAPFWSSRLGRHRLRGYQESRRGGFVEVEHQGDRVRLGGRARTVVEGHWVA